MDELLTVAELGEWLRLESSGVYTLMKRGILQKGIHWIKPTGLGPRFKRQAISDWLEGKSKPAPEQTGIRMVRGYAMR